MTKQGIIVKFDVEQSEVGLYHDALYYYMTNDGSPEGFLACWPFIKTATFQIEMDNLKEAKTYIKQYVEKFINEINDTNLNNEWKEKYLSKNERFPAVNVLLYHTSEDGEFDYYA